MSKKYYILLTSIVLASHFSWAQAPKCRQLFSSTEVVQNNVTHQEQVLKLEKWLNYFFYNEKIFKLSEAPKWDDFKNAVSLLELIESEKIDFINDSKSQKEEILRLLKEKGHVQYVVNIKNKKQARFYDKYYDFFAILQKINQRLGLEVYQLPHTEQLSKYKVKSSKQLVEDVKEILSQHERTFKTLFSKSKYRNLEEFKRQQFEKYPKLQEGIEYAEKNLAVGIHLNPRSRFWVQHVGFRNQRVVGRSTGGYNVEKMDLIESQLIGHNREKYTELSDRLKPVYGEVIPKPELLAEMSYPFMSSMNNGYGSDVWVIKNESIQDRTTYTMVDSWNVEKRRYNQEKLWRFLAIYPKVRSFFLGLIYHEQAQFKIHQIKTDSEFQQQFIASVFFTEAQIWAPINIKNVESFVFYSEQPEKSFYDFLISNHIKVYDGRSGVPVLYQPVSE